MRWQPLKLTVILIFFLPFIIIEFTILCNQDRIVLDGTEGEIFGLIFSTDTKYSKGYTHDNFAKIKVGMTEKEVLNILGEPLLRWLPYQYGNFQSKKHFIGLQYSESPSGTNYRLRQVYLDKGIVAETIHYFYND